MRILFKLFLLAFLILTSSLLQAQDGYIRGTVYNDTDGEVIPGVTVVVDESEIGTITDLDGNFNLTVEPGVYNITVSYITFKTLEISDIEVKDGEVSVFDNIRLKESSEELPEVTVTATVINNTDAALNTVKIKSVNLIDGISAMTLKRIGDSDAASSMKRVPGVSVEGGKYVFVRGLGDRYSKTTLNGADVPGLDPDKNTIQMDIFPTNILDNLLVHKSFSADLPADFTGGVIDIQIKDFPDKRIGNISVNASYSPEYHFNSNYLTYEGGKYDMLGFDDGTRDIPAEENIPEYATVFQFPESPEGQRYKEILDNFNPNMSTIKEKSLLDYGMSLSYGNQHPLEKLTIGYNFSFSYSNKTEFYENAEFGKYALAQDSSVNELNRRDYRIGDFGVNNAFLSGLAGFALKTKNSKFRIYALHLQNGESKAGYFDYEATSLGTTFDAFQHALSYSERSLTNLLVDGKHKLADGSWNIEWKLSPSISRITEPDIRFTRYTSQPNDPYVISSESGFPERNWRYLDETDLAGVLHISKEFKFLGRDAKIKFGGAYTNKDRNYAIKGFQIIPREVDSDDIILTGDPDELFTEENLWPVNGNGRIGVTFNSNNDSTKEYNAVVDYYAAYASLEVKILENLKTIIGVRYENFIDYFTGQDHEGNNYVDEKVLDDSDFFPTISLIYSLHERQNLRFSFSQTIARPSMKELSYVTIFDPISGLSFFGSLAPIEGLWEGNIQSTTIQNFDLRWELFETGGQMFSVSTFYKLFKNPIEYIQSVDQKPSIQARNVGDGLVTGAEFELKQSLDFLGGISLTNFNLLSNFTYIYSRVKLSEIEYNSRLENLRVDQKLDEYRDMAGMSPFIVNAGLSYNGGQTGFWQGFEAGLYYNVQGRALYRVGLSTIPDVYTNPFHSLNFNSSKRFGKNNKFNIGLKVDNILNSKKEYVYDAYEAEDQYFEYYQKGTRIQLKFTYNF
jgi:hypothetical protein